MSTIEVMRKALEALEHPQAGLVPHQGEWRSRTSLAIDALRAELERLEAVEPVCNPHPKAPHGFNRNASHSAGRSVCDCESWDPYEEGYQAGLLAGLAHDSAPIAPAAERRLRWLHSAKAVDAQGYEWGIFRVKWEAGRAIEVLQTMQDMSDLDAAMRDTPAACDGSLCMQTNRCSYTPCQSRAATPAPSTIPALTIEDVAESAPEFADVPKYGSAYLAGAHWAYTLAAARTGARIIKADPLQELADDARQIGLEY